MLRWSAETTGRTVDIGAVGDAEIDPRVEAGFALSSLGRAGASLVEPDSAAAERVAAELGPAAASDAAAVAAAFEGLNRIVDGVGLPVGRGSRRDDADIIEALGLGRFPHAHHGA